METPSLDKNRSSNINVNESDSIVNSYCGLFGDRTMFKTAIVTNRNKYNPTN